MTSPARFFVHPAALVETICIGEGTRIWAFAHVMPGVTIGAGCNIGDHTFIESNVQLGNHVTVKNGVSIWEHVHIADNVFVGPNVAFTNDRFPRNPKSSWNPEATWIEEGVTIGANATLLCGLRVGTRALIGAGAVVTGNVPAHALMVGNPATRRGWVCECARPLPAAAGGHARCAHCEREYAVTAESCSPRSVGPDPGR